MNQLIWTLFEQTGNIETYLLLKHIESDETNRHDENNQVKDIATMHTKM